MKMIRNEPKKVPGALVAGMVPMSTVFYLEAFVRTWVRLTSDLSTLA
jgi:hypothetical protein